MALLVAAHPVRFSLPFVFLCVLCASVVDRTQRFFGDSRTGGGPARIL